MYTVSVTFDDIGRLREIDNNIGLAEKFAKLHEFLRELYPFVTHISCALYDSENNIVKTYLGSNSGRKPLVNYEARLDDAPSLKEIVDRGRPRIVNDLSVFSDGKREHTQRIQSHNYKASYTVPIYRRGVFVGFLFFNADRKNVFTSELLARLEPIIRLIELTILNELNVVHSLQASVKTALDMTRARDDETGAHLNRMSRYSHLIARRLAQKFNLDDEYIEKIFAFSPLHDIGKIAIPDRLLFKPDKLDELEREEMKVHTTRGREIIDRMLRHFEFENLPQIDILRHIVELHHEKVDGSGYPIGLAGNDIPIEARIVAVADIFDALTSKRPYKEAWSNEDAFAELRALAGNKLDADCVEALISEHQQVLEIQKRFREDNIG